MGKNKKIIIQTAVAMGKNKKIIQAVLAVVILFVGFGILKKLASMRKPPVKKPRVVTSPLLNAERVHSESMQMVVNGFGTVRPKVEIKVIPQVSGKVVACHANFVNGGFFKAGEGLITIDPQDYAFAVENAAATVAQAQVQLDKELAEQVVALQEWGQLYEGAEPTSPLVRRDLQVNYAKAQLKSAEASLKTAELNLDRTVIRVPFDGRISEESVDLGQFVTVGQSLATVYATDAVEIVVPLADHKLAWFDVPLGYQNGQGQGDQKGSEVELTSDFAGAIHTWSGRVVRTEGRIDPMSRMVNIVIEVEKPFELSNSRPPLVPGMFVEVGIKGKMLDNVVRIRRDAVHNRNEVWVHEGDVLRIKQVEIARQGKEYSYVSSGIEDGSVVVTSPLDAVMDGMKIRIEIEGEEMEETEDSSE